MGFPGLSWFVPSSLVEIPRQGEHTEIGEPDFFRSSNPLSLKCQEVERIKGITVAIHKGVLSELPNSKLVK